MLRASTVIAVAVFGIASGCNFEAMAGGVSAGLGDTSGSGSSSTMDPSPAVTDGSQSGAGTSSVGDTTSAIDGSSTSGEVDPTLEATSTDDTTTARVPSCSSALLVTGNPDTTTSQDAPFVERLMELGYSVSVVHNADSQASDADGHCLVLLSALGSASDVDGKFREVEVAVITWEYNLYDDMAMVLPVSGNWGIAEQQDEIEIVDSSHPLAAGLQGIASIFAGGGRISWGIAAGDAQIVARLPSDGTHATLFAFEAGAMMADGFVAPARRVAFPGGETPVLVTEQAVALFEAAVLWAGQ